jgi:hypothetical protein
VTLHLEKLWSQNITITTRLVDAVTTPLLLKTVMAGKLKPKQLVTHHFTLDDILKAYDTFGNAGRERALKVILTNQWADSRAARTNYFTARLAKWTDQWAGSQPAGKTT